MNEMNYENMIQLTVNLIMTALMIFLGHIWPIEVGFGIAMTILIQLMRIVSVLLDIRSKL